MNKMTPGPWAIEKTVSQSGSPLTSIVRDVPAKGGIRSLIAVIPDRCPSAAQCGPNAQAIAALPDLIKALKYYASIHVSTYPIVSGLPAIEALKKAGVE